MGVDHQSMTHRLTVTSSTAGVVPSYDGICAELSVVLAICQLFIILLQWSRVKSFIITALDRGSPNCSQGVWFKVNSLCSGPGAFSWKSSSLSLYSAQGSGQQLLYVVFTLLHVLSMIRSSVGEGAVKCVQKLRVLCAVVEEKVEEESEMREEEGKDLVSRAISAHSDWLGGCQTESHYRQGKFWSHMEYHSPLYSICSMATVLPRGLQGGSPHPLTLPFPLSLPFPLLPLSPVSLAVWSMLC